MVSQSIKERALFYNFWSISRYNLNWDLMFLGNKSKLCKCRANQIFWRIRLRQPVWSYTPITIIRMISWAGMSVDKIFIFFFAMFCDNCLLSIFDASINFMRHKFQLVLFPITLYFYLLIHYSWCSELITGHCDKTKILNSTDMIFKGRNLSLVNLFCWH